MTATGDSPEIVENSTIVTQLGAPCLARCGTVRHSVHNVASEWRKLCQQHRKWSYRDPRASAGSVRCVPHTWPEPILVASCFS